MAHIVATMIEILEQDQHHLDLDCKKQIDKFLKKARSWRDTLLQRPFEICGDILSLDSSDRRLRLRIQLINAVRRAEDEIEVHIRNQVLPSEDDEVDSQLDLAYLVEKFESIMEEMSEDCDGCRKLLIFCLVCGIDDRKWWAFDSHTRPSLPVDHLVSEQVPWYPKLDRCTKDDVTDIFEDCFQTLKARLIGGSSQLRIISIDGMPGMGKRTLARRLFNDPLISTHFHTRAWLSSPVENNERSCILSLLEGLGMLTTEMRQKDDDELKVHIRNALKNIKYFIVIHDITNKEKWVMFTRLFRNYGVGARIIFTTYDLKKATISTYGERYRMRLLTDSESWFLLCRKVFGRGHCPDELEPVGKVIMQLCKGNPQIVSLVAGVLATSEKTKATWELVTTALGRKRHTVNIREIQLDLLILIYYHLPHYLRPCLLYVGAFYESRDIKASKIIQLWIAEGFVKQSGDQCLEDVAEMYLRILIDKNLLELTHEEPNGRIKTFRPQLNLKTAYWWLANFEKFLGSKYLHESMDAEEEKLVRRVSAHGLCQPGNESELPVLARSFLSVSGASWRQVSIYLKLRLLRVLEVFQVEFYQFPMEILQQVLLRYLAFSCHSNQPNSFTILRNLQTLIIRRLPPFRAFSLPSDLWGLTKLRHVKCKESFILNHPRTRKKVVHWNLETLSNMQLFGVTDQFLGMIPNIRNLGIFCNIAMQSVFDLACLDKLETLKCSSDWSLASHNFLSNLTLPRSLRKLTLSLCRIPLEFMELVGSLYCLEILKLQKSDFVGMDSAQTEPEWATTEGEFPQLLSLEMLNLNLVHWRAKATHFPMIKHLNVQNCYAMVEIPLDIGNIQTLEMIQVNETSPSALVSAMQIKREQEGRGNKFLQVRTHKVI